MTVVIDTNVILVANNQHSQVSSRCVAECASRLQSIIGGQRVAIDDGFRILREYQRTTTPNVGKRPGDVFLKWLLRNVANPSRCDQVKVTEHLDRGFDSFPDDDRLKAFDRADRKFVAVAAAHDARPPILQATDSKWLDWEPALQEHGLTVEFLCLADVQAFSDKKTKKKGGPSR